MTELVKCLSRVSVVIGKFTTRALGKICETGHAKVVVEKGAVPKLVDLLSRSDEKLFFSVADILHFICQAGYDKDVKTFVDRDVLDCIGKHRQSSNLELSGVANSLFDVLVPPRNEFYSVSDDPMDVQVNDREDSTATVNSPLNPEPEPYPRSTNNTRFVKPQDLHMAIYGNKKGLFGGRTNT